MSTDPVATKIRCDACPVMCYIAEGRTGACDRYANLEISYLLQKMEEYEGVVLLASNLRENMDEAFVRRLRHLLVSSRHQLLRPAVR